LHSNFYHMRFIAHRASFAQDMSDDERVLMRAHVAYWSAKIAERTALCFGPVLDPHASWGFAILRVDSDEEAGALIAGDPARALGRHEVFPIAQLIGMTQTPIR